MGAAPPKKKIDRQLGLKAYQVVTVAAVNIK